ncbi:hypothetical protein F5X68DRAFT_49265 [Plectosphaerella plurivora]|uniref:Uncharacterized protein n=1 Tax=Plectosphaerella plurivora TaxID=936078 RepID=A0A9P8VLT6_9PEZI|nr:hypothetical protein F5X68DRAFT_49265 [Plectosphaerella plurivora]
MAGRGVLSAAAGRQRGSGRPNKVTKPGSRGRGRQGSISVEHLEAHLKDQDDEERQSSVERGNEDDEEDDDEQQQQQHQSHDPEMDAAADNDQRGFEYAAPSASTAAHSLLANGPSHHHQQQQQQQQTSDADIHPALQGLVPHPSDVSQAQAQAQQAFAMEAPMHASNEQQQQHHAPLPPQQQQQQHQGGGGNSGGGPHHRTATDLSKESGYPELVIDSALSKRLADAPGVRQAVQRRLDQGLNLKRRSNVEALLAHVSGREAHSPCKSCHKGYGPWNGCIVVSGLMCGSCSNCWFNASGSRCSFHETNLPQQHQHVPAIAPTGPIAPGFIAPASLAGAALQPLQQAGIPVLSAPPPAPAPAGNPVPVIPQIQPALGANVSDHWARDVFERALADLRSGDPNLRYQARIKAKARSLALAVSEYNDWLSMQDGGSDHAGANLDQGMSRDAPGEEEP